MANITIKGKPVTPWTNSQGEGLSGTWYCPFLINNDYPTDTGFSWGWCQSDGLATFEYQGIMIAKYTNGAPALGGGQLARDDGNTIGYGNQEFLALVTMNYPISGDIPIAWHSDYVTSGWVWGEQINYNPYATLAANRRFQDLFWTWSNAVAYSTVLMARADGIGIYTGSLNYPTYRSSFDTTAYGEVSNPSLHNMWGVDSSGKQTSNSYWVMFCSIDGSALGKRSGVAYWVGSYNYTTFTPLQAEPKWLDLGLDYCDAVITTDWDIPNDASMNVLYMLGRVANPAYAASLQSAGYRGEHALSRMIKLVDGSSPTANVSLVIGGSTASAVATVGTNQSGVSNNYVVTLGAGEYATKCVASLVMDTLPDSYVFQFGNSVLFTLDFVNEVFTVTRPNGSGYLSAVNVGGYLDDIWDRDYSYPIDRTMFSTVIDIVAYITPAGTELVINSGYICATALGSVTTNAQAYATFEVTANAVSAVTTTSIIGLTFTTLPTDGWSNNYDANLWGDGGGSAVGLVKKGMSAPKLNQGKYWQYERRVTCWPNTGFAGSIAALAAMRSVDSSKIQYVDPTSGNTTEYQPGETQSNVTTLASPYGFEPNQVFIDDEGLITGTKGATALLSTGILTADKTGQATVAYYGANPWMLGSNVVLNTTNPEDLTLPDAAFRDAFVFRNGKTGSLTNYYYLVTVPNGIAFTDSTFKVLSVLDTSEWGQTRYPQIFSMQILDKSGDATSATYHTLIFTADGRDHGRNFGVMYWNGYFDGTTFHVATPEPDWLDVGPDLGYLKLTGDSSDIPDLKVAEPYLVGTGVYNENGLPQISYASDGSFTPDDIWTAFGPMDLWATQRIAWIGASTRNRKLTLVSENSGRTRMWHRFMDQSFSVSQLLDAGDNTILITPSSLYKANVLFNMENLVPHIQPGDLIAEFIFNNLTVVINVSKATLTVTRTATPYQQTNTNNVTVPNWDPTSAALGWEPIDITSMLSTVGTATMCNITFYVAPDFIEIDLGGSLATFMTGDNYNMPNQITVKNTSVADFGTLELVSASMAELYTNNYLSIYGS